MKRSLNAVAITALANGNQRTLNKLARLVTVTLADCAVCPECGHLGPHGTNGGTRRVDLSYCCAECGMHFDAEEV